MKKNRITILWTASNGSSHSADPESNSQVKISIAGKQKGQSVVKALKKQLFTRLKNETSKKISRKITEKYYE